MAASLRDLRRKIKSIKSTQKITAAMQLVAASKMQRATKQALESRTYSRLLGELITTIAGTTTVTDQPLFHVRPEEKILVLLVTTNRGLAGSLNAQLLRAFFEWRTQLIDQGRTLQIVVVGAKGRAAVARLARASLMADFAAPDTIPTFADARPIAQLLIEEFQTGRADAVYLAYNHFISTLRQEPRIVSFLPFRTESLAGQASRQVTEAKGKEVIEPATSLVPFTPNDLLFEPSQAEVLQALVPRALRSQLYQVLLETHASEQSARMVAMKNATDNASDLVDDLTLTYHGVRQAAITGELLDIAAGASALAS